jgi:hypothetical protein
MAGVESLGGDGAAEEASTAEDEQVHANSVRDRDGKREGPTRVR